MASTTPRDPYEVLGITRTADEGQIKKAFRGLARELHPDVNRHDPDAEAKFKEAAEAYEILSDPERRATYDRYGHEGLRSGGWAPSSDGVRLADRPLRRVLRRRRGGGMFGGRGGPAPRRRRGGVGRRSTSPRRRPAFRWRSPTRPSSTCERCHGNRAEPGTPIKTCDRCEGAGQLQAVSRTPFGQVVRTVPCDVCDGDGKVAETPCTQCRGRGREAGRRTLKVDVPAGIADGQRIRISGRGHAGEPGAPGGDLYVLVGVREDERFVRDGDDLVTVLDVPAPLAALGSTLQVPTLDGPVDVEVHPGTQPGEIVNLRGHGMPALRRAGRRGDLHVVVNVVVPRRLSGDQRRLLEQLSESITDENLRSDDGMLSKLRRLLHR